MSLAERLAKQLENRRLVAEEGRMQDVAQREAEIAERVRLLRKGMTVAEAVDVMGSPDGVSMISEETTIEVPLPPGVFKGAVDRPESGYEVQITLAPGNLEDALQHPELVYQLIYTPYEQQKNHPDLAGSVNTGPPPGPYKVFVLIFRSFTGKIRDNLLVWTEPFEDELLRAGQEQ